MRSGQNKLTDNVYKRVYKTFIEFYRVRLSNEIGILDEYTVTTDRVLNVSSVLDSQKDCRRGRV